MRSTRMIIKKGGERKSISFVISRQISDRSEKEWRRQVTKTKKLIFAIKITLHMPINVTLTQYICVIVGADYYGAGTLSETIRAEEAAR